MRGTIKQQVASMCGDIMEKLFALACASPEEYNAGQSLLRSDASALIKMAKGLFNKT
jgi:hypothetical protein